MKLISDYFGQTLEIITPSLLKSVFHFRANGIDVATLKGVNFWCTRYEIEGFGNTWELYCPSIWKGKTEIREKGKELPDAVYEGGGLKHSGVFSLPRGEKVALVFNLWKSFYELQKENGEVLVHFKNKSAFSSTVVVTINRKSELLDKYPYLILFSYYIAMQRNNAAAAVAH